MNKKSNEEFVVKVSGRQERTSVGSKITCNRIHAEEGEHVEIPVIGFFDDLKSRGVAKALVVSHYLGKKVRFFYKTARGGDRNMGSSSRPRLTDLLIEEVEEEGDE